MPIVGELDIYRKQITFDYLDTVTDVRLPGLHAHLREIQERALLAEADHDLETMRAKLKAVNDQLRRRMHQSIPEQGRWLASVVRGHMAYYAVPGNYEAVAAFCDQVTRYWLKALRRRSQKTCGARLLDLAGLWAEIIAE